MILQTLEKMNGHPTADQIYSEVSKKLPHISLATVYRNLELFTDCDMVQTVAFEMSKTHYDSDAKRHHHFRCSDCERIVDINLELEDNPVEKLERKVSFRIDGYDLYFHGKCENCTDER